MIRIGLLLLINAFCVVSLFTQIPNKEEEPIFEAQINTEKTVPPSSFSLKDSTPVKVYKGKYGVKPAKYQNGKYGFMDTKGELITPIEYNEYLSIDQNRIIVKKDKHWGVISFKNEVIIPFKYKGYNPIEKLRFMDAYKLRMSSKYGMADFDGNLILPLEFDKINFIGWHSIVQKNGKSGLCDYNGKVILEPIYNKVTYFLNSYYVVETPNNSNIVDAITGNMLLGSGYDKLEIMSSRKGRIVATKGAKVGMINLLEDVLIPFEYDKIESLNNIFVKFPIYKVIKNGKAGIYDISQKLELHPPEFQEIYDYAEGLYIISKDDKYGISYFLDNELTSIIPVVYDKFKRRTKTDILVFKDDMVGIFNISARKIVVPIIYDKIEPINPDYDETISYSANQAGEITLFNALNHQVLVEERFDEISFKEGFIIGLVNNKYYLISETGYKYQIGLDDLTIINRAFVKIKKQGKWGVYNAISKQVVLPCDYGQILFDSDSNTFQAGDEIYRVLGNKLNNKN